MGGNRGLGIGTIVPPNSEPPSQFPHTQNAVGPQTQNAVGPHTQDAVGPQTQHAV